MKNTVRKIVCLLLLLSLMIPMAPAFGLTAKAEDEPAGVRAAGAPLPRPPSGTSRDDILAYYGNGAYGDTSLTFEERAADLVSRLTPAEKMDQLLATWGTPRAAVPTLGIQANRWWKEALHGIAREGRATSFPAPLNMAAMWNPDLMLEMSIAISNEGRWHSNSGVNASPGNSLTYWSPTINLHRDPRWGRNEETMGEDPYLAAETASMFVSGMQGDEKTALLDPNYDPKYLKTATTIKHFAANNSEGNRHGGETIINDRTLREYYLNVFQRVAENTKVEAAMTAYNKVNGVPSPAHTYMVDDLLRKTWGFNGHVVSDCGAINDIVGGSGGRWPYTSTNSAQTATARSIRAGTDLNCSFNNVYNSNALAAINSGYMSEDDLDRALLHAFTERMRTGEFDPPANNKYRSIGNVLEAPDHLRLAQQTSLESLLLLKNDVPDVPVSAGKKALPFDLSSVPNGGSIVMAGDFANYFELGDYSGAPTNNVPILDGMRAYINQYNAANPGRNLQFQYFKGNPTTVTGGGGGVSGYMRNIRDFTFEYTDNTTVTQRAVEANTIVGMQYESNNLGYIADGSYATYSTGLSIENLRKITVSSAAPSGQHNPVYVHFRAGNNKGPVLATIETGRTGDWQVYQAYPASSVTVNIDTEGLAKAITDLGIRPTICMVVSSDANPDPSANLDDMASDYASALAAAATADLTIVFVGSGQQASGLPDGYKLCAEERDRANLNLPLKQDVLAREMCKVSKRSVVAMHSVGFHTVEEFIDETDAFIFASYNGQYQGWALPRVIFGDYNPSARLPFTWYADESQMPGVYDYSIRAVPNAAGNGFTNYGRTYQYFTGDVQWPFGFGLSYTDYEISNVRLSSATAGVRDKVTVLFDVENKGAVPGAQTVQVYVTSPKAYSAPGVRDYNYPIRQLRGFKHVKLDANEKKVNLSVELDVNDFFFFDTPDNSGFENEFGRPRVQGKRVVYSGDYTIAVGSSSQSSDLVNRTLTVTGTAKLNGDPEDGYKPWLKTATLTGGKIWAEPGVRVKSNLAVALNDERLFQTDERQLNPQINEKNDPPIPHKTISNLIGELAACGVECSVEFISDNPAVARVNAQTGEVRALANGATTIRARVTINGKTWEAAADGEKLEASYPLAVNGEPLQDTEAAYITGITINGAPIDSFNPDAAFHKDITEYSVTLPFGSALPVVAGVNGGAMHSVTAAQVAALPGTAYITVINIPDGVDDANQATTVYSVSFRLAPPDIAINLDGAPLAGFDPEETAYTVRLEAGAALPAVTVTGANAADADVSAPVEISSSLKRVTVTVSKNGSTVVYVIDFRSGKQLKSDIFTTGQMTPGLWSVLDRNTFNDPAYTGKEDPSAYRIDSNGLTVTTQFGDIYQGQKDANNIFFQEAGDEDFSATLAMTFAPLPFNNNYAQGSLLVMQDDNNYVKISVERQSGNTGVRIQYAKEENASFPNSQPSVNLTTANNGVSGGEINNGDLLEFRITRTGNTYGADYRINKGAWNTKGKLPDITFAMKDVKVGMVACGNQSTSTAPINVSFKSFMVEGDEQGEPKITIGKQPESTGVKAGAITAILEVEASASHSGNLTYQWYRRAYNSSSPTNTALPGETGPAFAIPAGLAIGTRALYYCVLSSNNGAPPVTTDIAVVSVNLGLDTTEGPKSDLFRNTGKDFQADWGFVRENASLWSQSLTKGLQIATAATDIYQDKNDAMMLLQPGGGNWTVSTDIVFPTVIPNANYQQGSLVAWEDDDCYVKLSCESGGGRTYVQFMFERDGQCMGSWNAGVPAAQQDTIKASGSSETTLQPGDTITLYIKRQGSVYSAWYAINGVLQKAFTDITLEMNEVYVGLLACHNATATSALAVNFRNFIVEGDGHEPMKTMAKFMTQSGVETAGFVVVNESVSAALETLCIVALYDASGKLISITKQTVIAAPGRIAAAEIIPPGSYAYAKAYIWDASTFVPLCAPAQ